MAKKKTKTVRSATARAAPKPGTIRVYMYGREHDLTAVDLNTELPDGLVIHCDWGRHRVPPKTTIGKVLHDMFGSESASVVPAQIPEKLVRRHDQLTGKDVYYIFKPITGPSAKIQVYGDVGCIWPDGKF